MFEYDSMFLFIVDFCDIKSLEANYIFWLFGFEMIEDKHCCSNEFQIYFISAFLIIFFGVSFEVWCYFLVHWLAVIALPNIGMES